MVGLLGFAWLQEAVQKWKGAKKRGNIGIERTDGGKAEWVDARTKAVTTQQYIELREGDAVVSHKGALVRVRGTDPKQRAHTHGMPMKLALAGADENFRVESALELKGKKAHFCRTKPPCKGGVGKKAPFVPPGCNNGQAHRHGFSDLGRDFCACVPRGVAVAGC